MSNKNVMEFYDELSSDYHLIFGDWNSSIKKQAQLLDCVIKEKAKTQSISLLDCSCGIGTQAIGLAQMGYKVHATDLSPKAIERAKIEAESRNVSMTFGVADFKELEKQVEGTFDVIISCDNSLPHLLKNDDLYLTSKNIFTKLNSKGLFVGSIRDYDKILESKPVSNSPVVKDDDNERTISFQVWDWEDNNIYTINHFTLKGSNDEFDTSLRTTKYKAYRRYEITEIFEKSGFEKIEWLMPEDTKYYQPIIVASKP